MIFSSPIFLFWFLPMVLLFYFLVDAKFKNIVLLVFSLLFYAWGEGKLVTIMLASSLLNYLIGLALEKCHYKSLKKATLIFGIISNLLILIFYKYSNFIVDNLNVINAKLGHEAFIFEKIILPLGISFYTFHGISYIIDVYRAQARAQKNPFDLTLYFSFFPQLIAGPIVRYKDIEHQIVNRKINKELFVSGIKRFIIGISKKMLVANVIGRVPNLIFNLPEQELNAYWSWLAIIGATLQVYIDFSAYSDMAIGLARMFGFQFKENFTYPFIAKSMKEFWTRWHISLSSWFKDYVYIPLGGSKKGKLRTYLNISIIFILTGFWHGASWSFILFGAFHGLLIILEKMGLELILNKIPTFLRSIYVFLITCFSIIFFSIDNLHYIKQFYKSLFHFNTPNEFHKLNLYLTTEWYVMLVVGILISIPSVEFIFNKIKNLALKNSLELSCLLILFILSISELANSTYNPFIYFRF